MSQPASPQTPESFAGRPDSVPTGDVLSTLLRTVHLAGHDVTEIAADPPARWVQRDDMGAVHLVEGGEVQVEVAGAEPHILRSGDVALLPAGRAHVLSVTGPGARWLTGTFIHDGATSNRLLAALPDVIAFERLRERGYEWHVAGYQYEAA